MIKSSVNGLCRWRFEKKMLCLQKGLAVIVFEDWLRISITVLFLKLATVLDFVFCCF